MRQLILLLGIVAMSISVFGQSTPTDSQNLRALLEEVRLLRRDLQTAMVAAERAQIALYRLERQDETVARATKLVEETHAKLADLAAERKRVTTQIEQGEDLRSHTQDAHERRVIEEEALPQFKQHLERITGEEQQWQSKANEAEGQLKVEQVKLDALHAVLDQLDEALQNVGRNGENISSVK